jgi:glycosyltransferase involved in cell wall biosynthesis
METDLAVIGRDPLFGDGAHAQTEAFLDGASALGRHARTYFDPHPGLRGPAVTWRRIEALRVVTAPRRIDLPSEGSLWVVSTHAPDGYPAALTGRAYSCWIGTTIESEWRGRRAGLPRARRIAGRASLSLLRGLERRVLEGARTVYATSASSRAEIAEAGRRDDVRVLPIPIDTEHLLPAPDVQWRDTLATPTVLFLGRADDPRKNASLLVEVARMLPGVRFVFGGRSPTGSVPSNVQRLGRVEDTGAYLRTGSIFALTSLQEGFGIVAAEALSCGLPVITTPSGGPEALVRDSGGGTVTATFDPAEFAEHVERLLGGPDLLAQMRERGRAYVRAEHSYAIFRRRLACALAMGPE